jgi:hypothetical protein
VVLIPVEFVSAPAAFPVCLALSSEMLGTAMSNTTPRNTTAVGSQVCVFKNATHLVNSFRTLHNPVGGS